MQGLNWRGQPIDPANLLKKYHMSIAPAPAGKAWRVVALWETHGRPELRNVVEGTTDRITFFARTTAGLELAGLRSDLKEEGNLMVLNVKNESYFEPRKMPGPWTVYVQGQPSEQVSGWGLAVDPDAQYGGNPAMEDDNRYLTCIVVWRLEDGGSVPPVVPPTDPSVTPQPPTGLPAADLASLQAYVDKRIDERIKAAFGRAAGAV